MLYPAFIMYVKNPKNERNLNNFLSISLSIKLFRIRTERIIIDKLNVLRQSVIANLLTSAKGKNSRSIKLSALKLIIMIENVAMSIHLKV